jgi:hypothetical protein
MPRLLAVLALACFAPLAAARTEDEPKTYDLHTWNVVWKAGDTATVKTDDASPSVMRTTQPDPKTGKEGTKTREQITQEVSTYVLKCLEADDDGQGTKFLVHIAEWTHSGMQKIDGVEKALDPETSLKSLHLEMAVKDGARSFKILTPDTKPSADGKAWLEARFGSRQKAKWVLDLDFLGRPGGPVKVGDTWTGDPAKVDFALPLDPAASTIKIRLASVTDGTMRLPIEMRLKATGLPSAGGIVVPFTQGGVFESDYTVTHSMAPRTFDSAQTIMGSFKGTASLPGLKIEVDFGSASETRTSTGGDMPKPPAEDAK